MFSLFKRLSKLVRALRTLVIDSASFIAGLCRRCVGKTGSVVDSITCGLAEDESSADVTRCSNERSCSCVLPKPVVLSISATYDLGADEAVNDVTRC